MRIQRLQKGLGRRRRWDGSLQRDVLRRDLFPVEGLIGAIVGAKRGTRERNTREQSARARIGENFCAEGHIGLGGCVPADWSGGSGSVAADLHFAGENAAGGALAHEEQNEVGGLATELDPEAAAFESHHAGSAPRTAHVWAAATRHDAATVARADDKCSLENRGKDDDAVSFVDDALRDVVGDVHDFFHDSAGVFDAILLLRLRVGGDGERSREYKG
jgi:hypothetical protein